MTHKTKATKGGRQWHNTKLEHIQNTRLLAGGQCYQSDSVSCQACSDCFFMCSLRNFSRAKAHGANLSDSGSCATFVRCFLRAGEGVFVNSLSFMVHTCIAMCRSSSHHGAGRFYPLGSIPRCCNSLRIIRFIQAARESSPSCCCAFSIFSRKSGSKRNWNGGLPRLSFLCVDTLITPHVMYLCVMTHYTQSAQKAKPRTVGAVTGLLTTNDRKRIEVAMRNHTTHPQGRDSHNLNKYIWRFIALSTAQPRVIHIVATSEQEARQQSPTGCVMVFAARIRQGVCHA
ncbi:host cell division inhibitor Icd-like protein [Escherichia coli]|nr:host cell division inhibitor Icd-like protein [Escherichia coli]